MFYPRLLTLVCVSTFLAACSQDKPIPVVPKPAHSTDFEVEFTVKIENISAKASLQSALSPLVWTVGNPSPLPLFQAGSKASEGFERLTEDGDPEVLFEQLAPAVTQAKGLKGHQESPTAAGASQSFSFKAKAGAHLNFASMLAESNDLFVAPLNGAVELFDQDNEPISGPVTVTLWDAGTKQNQEPGKGDAQAPRQKAANTGTAENQVVRLLSATGDGFKYPDVNQVVKITISNNDNHEATQTDTAADGHDHAH